MKQAILMVVFIVVVALLAFIWFSPFLAQDACLDGGGAWKDGQCLR
jgi:hypothetical protein